MSSETNKPPIRLLETAPLFPVGLGLAMGIVLDDLTTPPGLSYVFPLVIASSSIIVAPIRRRFGFVCILVASVAVGGLLHFSSARVTPADSIERYATESGSLARLLGTVVHQPRILPPSRSPFSTWTHRIKRTGFVLAVDSIAGDKDPIPATGYVRVTVLEPVLDLDEGDEIEIFGRLYALRPLDNPGSFDWETYSRSQGIVAQIKCKHREAIRQVGQPGDSTTQSLLGTLRQRLRHLLVDGVSAEVSGSTGLLEGMVLGQRSEVSRIVNDLFIRAGCVHFLAVSGVHLVIVMWLARAIARLLGATGRTRILAMMVAIVFYAVVAEPRPPILRASIIGTIYCIACLFHRQRSRLNWVSACVVVLAIMRPEMIFDIGYQLSTAAVLGVSYLAPAFRALIAQLFCHESMNTEHSTPALTRLIRHAKWKLVQGLSISTAAWFAALPIVAGVFFRVHLWGILSSLLLLPFVTIVMALGFLKMMVGLVSPTGGVFLGSFLQSLSGLLLSCVELFAQLPGSAITVAKPPTYLVGLYYVALIMFVLAAQKRVRLDTVEENEKDEKDMAVSIVPRWTSNIAFAILGIGLIAWFLPAANSGKLTVTVLSMGRGSATVIEMPTGETFLYDAGSSYASDPGASTITPFLLTRGITSIDRIFITHPNLDHFSGIPTVTQSIETGPVIINHLFENRTKLRSPSRKLLALLGEQDHPVETLSPAPAKWAYDLVSVEYLWPTAEGNERYTTNDTSTVLRITYEGKSILMTGDIEIESQRALLDRGGLGADVLFLPHHGGVVQTTQAFVSAVDPSILIRSSSERMSETINGIDEIAQPYRLFNTADSGAIEIIIDADGIAVKTMRDRMAGLDENRSEP